MLLYGIVNLGLHIPGQTLVWVAVWLIAAVIIHNGVLSPIVVGVSTLLRRHVPDRGRRYLQAGLIAAVPVTVIALPMIYRQGSQPPSKAMLLQNFTANLGLLLGIDRCAVPGRLRDPRRPRPVSCAGSFARPPDPLSLWSVVESLPDIRPQSRGSVLP